MRLAAFIFAACLVTVLAGAAHAEYYCGVGFEASYGGQCVATLARDEIDLYLNAPAGEPYVPAVRPRRHRRHRGLSERY